MPSPFQRVLNWVAEKFSNDPAQMLVITGVAGWTLSSLAQIGAILFNPKISNEKKSFLVPQEAADALVNILSFFVITQSTKKLASSLFSTGKFAPKSVRAFLDKNKELYGKKVGKLDFNLDEVLKNDKKLLDSYETYKSLGTTAATIGAGILATNIITPLGRNVVASKSQKLYIAGKNSEPEAVKQPTFQAHYSGSMRI